MNKRPSCSTPVEELRAEEEWPAPAWEPPAQRSLRSLTVGSPLAPPTRLNPLGVKAIRDRLNLVTNIEGYPEDMAAAVRHAVEVILTQDLPALLDAVENPAEERCKLCLAIHATYHTLDFT